MELLHAVSIECIFIIHLLLKRSVTAHSAEVRLVNQNIRGL